MTKFTQLLVGIGIGVALGSGVAFYSQGTIQIGSPYEGLGGGPGQVDFVGGDVSLTATGVELLHVLNGACTGSGVRSINGLGGGAYAFCAIPLPSVIAGSGLLLGSDLQLECGNMGTTGQFDVAFGKGGVSDSSATGTTTIAVNQVLAGSATSVMVFTGSQVWNGADFLRIVTKELASTAGAFANGATDCRVRGYIRDFYGE